MELERISPASLAVGCRHTILHTLSTAVSLQAILSPLIYMQLHVHSSTAKCTHTSYHHHH